MFVFICLKTSTLSAHFGTLYTANAEARSEFREEKDQIYSQWTPDFYSKELIFQIVVKTLDSPLDSKEIKPVSPKGNQP